MGIKLIVLVFLLVSLVLFSGCLYESRKPKPELCESVSQQQNKDICYHGVAIENGDETLCNKIVGLNRRDECYTDLAVGRSYRSFD